MGALTVGSPVLGYRSIQKHHGHPTVQTDAQGRFGFDSVKLGEYVLTVEGKGYVPQSRNIKVSPQVQPEQFDLKPGRKISNRVLDPAGRPVTGACVVLNHWHAIPTILGCIAGKDVYVEKPEGHNIVEGQRMVTAMRKYNRIVQLGMQLRSAPHFHEAMDYIHSGALGKVLMAKP